MDATAARPTQIRYVVLTATVMTSFMLYLDRICMGQILASASFPLTGSAHAASREWIASAFFWSYALCQVPAGWLSDRFGARGMMTICVAAWSLFTIMTGLVDGFITLLIARLGVGIFQAAAYPTSVGLLRSWIPLKARATASAAVASGGRLGGVLAPWLTATLIVAFGSWSLPLFIYGVLGLFVAALFWVVFRRTPEGHPWCNDAERQLISAGRVVTAQDSQPIRGIPWGKVLTNRALWLDCAVQFCTNVGWVFIVTDLPRYLTQQGLSEQEAGGLTTLAFFIGMIGMLFGGPLTDWATHRMGLQWGRAVPAAASRLLATLAYVGCLLTGDVYLIVGCVAIMAFATDLGVPAIWAYQQDVGGRYTAALLGWANMWGNVGAAISPLLTGIILRLTGDEWWWVFFTYMLFFLVSAICSLGLDCRSVIDTPDEK